MSESGFEDDPAALEEAALRLLARREHSAQELRRKLRQRGVAQCAIERMVGSLQQRRLLSDQRFAEAYVRARRDKGFGPLRIRAELRERGVAEELIEAELDPSDPQWRELLRRVRERRFGSAPPGDRREQARQARFLQQRGFAAGEIRELLRQEE